MNQPTIIPIVDSPRAAERKLFSLTEANRSLPYVSRVVVDITEVYSQVLELRHELENLDEGDLRDLTEKEYDATLDRLGGLVDELHLTGAELRDFELGRVEFPARFRREEVMFTWQLGEKRIGYYHPLDADDDELMSLDALREHEAA